MDQSFYFRTNVTKGSIVHGELLEVMSGVSTEEIIVERSRGFFLKVGEGELLIVSCQNEGRKM